MRRAPWILAVGLLLIVTLLALGWWLKAGGPTGFAMHEAGTRIGDGTIRVSSERVFGKAKMQHVPPVGLALVVDDWQFLLQKGELSLGEHYKRRLPDGWSKLEVRAARNGLMILVDDEPLDQIDMRGNR